MTVAELIEQLAKHPSDAIVAISLPDADYEITELRATKVSPTPGAPQQVADRIEQFVNSDGAIKDEL